MIPHFFITHFPIIQFSLNSSSFLSLKLFPKLFTSLVTVTNGISCFYHIKQLIANIEEGYFIPSRAVFQNLPNAVTL